MREALLGQTFLLLLSNQLDVLFGNSRLRLVGRETNRGRSPIHPWSDHTQNSNHQNILTSEAVESADVAVGNL